jgi:peptidoglycan/xylan/chitin deacetylase (PgdA/CDA1 family)
MPAHVAPLYACKDTKAFERDLLTLLRDFRPVPHDAIVAAAEGGAPLPPRAVALSFDDGFEECYSVARPLLLRHGLPCTFFVIGSTLDNRALMHRNQVALCLSSLSRPGGGEAALAAVSRRCGRTFRQRAHLERWARSLRYRDRQDIHRLCEALEIDVAAYLRVNRPYLSEAQVRQLHADGFTIGAHTMDHPEMEHITPGERREQIARSCEHVRRLTGRERVPFAIPFNGLTLPRAELAQLRTDLGIDLIYDTNNLMPDREFIVNRIWCDTPRGASERRSNLPALLRRARFLEPLRGARRRLAGLPR